MSPTKECGTRPCFSSIGLVLRGSLPVGNIHERNGARLGLRQYVESQGESQALIRVNMPDGAPRSLGHSKPQRQTSTSTDNLYCCCARSLLADDPREAEPRHKKVRTDRILPQVTDGNPSDTGALRSMGQH
jgi:hypothetical protein